MSKKILATFGVSAILAASLVSIAPAEPAHAAAAAYTCNQLKGGDASYSWGRNYRSGSGGDCGAQAWIQRLVNGVVKTYTDDWAWNGDASEVWASVGYPYAHGCFFLN